MIGREEIFSLLGLKQQRLSIFILGSSRLIIEGNSPAEFGCCYGNQTHIKRDAGKKL